MGAEGAGPFGRARQGRRHQAVFQRRGDLQRGRSHAGQEAGDIAQELYLGFVLDRKEERVMIVASAAGGMEIEDISEKKPDSIIRATVDPGVGMQQFQAREIAFGLGLESSLIGKATETILGCYQVFRDYDAAMLEINPLVVTRDGNLVALDA